MKKIASKSLEGTSYEDVEGLTVSLGVIFALTLPAAMALQYVSHDDRVQEKNFLLLLCSQSDFRSFVVETMADNDTGNIGKYEMELFNFVIPYGGGQKLDTKAILQDDSLWPASEPGRAPDTIYECGSKKEIAASSHALLEHFPMHRMGVWALMHPETPLWSDDLGAFSAFAMSLLMAGLIGSLLLYVSLSLSPAREDTGKALRAWNRVGFVGLLGLFICLTAGIIVLLFAQDRYVETQDHFPWRAGRLGGYSKIAMLAIFLPAIVLFGVFSSMALIASCRKHKLKKAESDVGAEGNT